MSLLVYADDTGNEDPAHSEKQYDTTLDASSVEELKAKVLKAASLDGETLIKLAANDSPYEVGEVITIGGHTTVDLNCQTIRTSIKYPIVLEGDGASVTNGTLTGGGIKCPSIQNESGSISDMTIEDSPQYGIYVTGQLGEIRNNTVNRSRSSSIYLKSGTVSGAVEDNTIQDCGYIGIRLFSKSFSGNIKNNTITNTVYHGISLNGSSKSEVNDGATAGDISGNTLSECKGDGISVYHGSHCGSISDNILSAIGGHDTETNGDFGIIVNNGCNFTTYAEEIRNNTVSDVTFAAIVVFSGPHGDTSTKWQDRAYINGDISYNTVNNSSLVKEGIDWGGEANAACEGAIYVDSHAAVKGSIHNNQINTSHDNGICILAYSKVNDIYENEVNDTENAGISVTNHSKIYGQISNNQIRNSRRYGMFINNRSVVGQISDNQIDSPKLYGIQVSKQAKAKTVTGNTINCARVYGVVTSSKGKIDLLSWNNISTRRPGKSIGVYTKSSCRISKIRKNVITGRFKYGVKIESPDAQIKVLSNTINTENLREYRSAGISAYGCKKKQVRILYNKITGNRTAPGIKIKESAGLIKKNTIRRSKPRIKIVKSKYRVRY